MNKTISTLVAMLLMLVTCTTAAQAAPKDRNTVNYTVLNNYFHNNGAPLPSSPLITTQQAFDAQFGMAAHMGKDGQPTPVNFKKQVVLAIVLPETGKATTIDSVSVKVTGKNELTLAYTVNEGVDNGYTTQPIELMAIARKYKDYTVKVAARVNKNVTVTTGHYEFVTLQDMLHNLKLIVDYPVSGNEKLTSAVRQWLSARFAQMGNYFSTNALEPVNVPKNDGKSFLQAYARALGDRMDALHVEGENRCALDASVTIAYEDDRIVSYEANGYVFTGGAHGMSFCDGATFDKATGRQLTLVKSSADLLKLVTERLHRDSGISSDLHFNQEPVPMPAAQPYVVADGKIKFVYQPYEIGAYAMGKPQCTFYPYELEQYLTPDGKALMR